MADKTKLTRWLVDHRATLNPRFTEFSWPSRYYPGVYDFEAVIQIGETKAVGRGIDTDRELALEKASSEAIERHICQYFDLGSEGVAVSGRTTAEEHARNEVLERYYFERHVELNIPFHKVNSNVFSALTARFENKNPAARLRFFLMNAHRNFFGVISAIYVTHPWHPEFIGLALSPEPARAAAHALNEALANYARKIDAPGTYVPEAESRPGAWTAQPNYLKSVQHLFTSDTELWPAREPTIVVEKIDISEAHELDGCPIDPVRCRIWETQ